MTKRSKKQKKMGIEYEVPAKKPRSKPKVVKEWEEADVFKLIGLVEDQACLWNADDDGYHSKRVRDNAWQNISEHFDDRYSQTDLNAKWTNLRIQFRGYAAKAKSGHGEVKPPKWRFFNAMSFVGRTEEHRTQPTSSNSFLKLESDSVSVDSSVTATPTLLTLRQSQVSSTQSASSQIDETVHGAVAAKRVRNQNSLEANAAFTNYLLSELKTLDDDAAASVRKKVTCFFLQCIGEEREERF